MTDTFLSPIAAAEALCVRALASTAESRAQTDQVGMNARMSTRAVCAIIRAIAEEQARAGDCGMDPEALHQAISCAATDLIMTGLGTIMNGPPTHDVIVVTLERIKHRATKCNRQQPGSARIVRPQGRA